MSPTQTSNYSSCSINFSSLLMNENNFNWNATSFFEQLTATNKLAQEKHFAFLRVSGLEGLEEVLHTLQSVTAFVAVSDIAQGYTELNNTPHTRSSIM